MDYYVGFHKLTGDSSKLNTASKLTINHTIITVRKRNVRRFITVKI